MKRVFILCAALLCGGIAQAQYQLYNPGFESWEGTSLTAKPSNWSSFPQADGNYASMASTPQHYHRYGGRPGTSGSSFVTIWTRNSFLGILANGNMTTGQIHAGATSASSSNNYNYTHRGTAYCHPFSGTPDSMYVWVSFYAASASSTGVVKAFLHGDNDFRDPNDAEDGTKYRGKAICTFNRTSSNASQYNWQQKRIAFNYNGYSTVNYILMSLSTNATPGGGSVNDSLSIDDIEFIYSAWLDNISVNWDSIPTFSRGTLNYTVDIPSYDLLGASTIQFSTQAYDATATVDTLWINDTTRQFIIHVVAEDTVTMRDYTVTLVSPAPPCDTVDNLGAQVFVNNVTVSWTPGTNNTDFEVEYGMGDTPADSATLLATIDPIVTFSNLEYGTTYWCRVRAICRDTVYTDWSTPLVFTTDTLPVLECPAVDTLILDTLGLSFATLHWSRPADSADTALLFHVTLLHGGEPLVSYDTPDTFFTTDDLMPGLVYILSVATICDSDRISTPCILAFTTLPDTVGIAHPAPLASHLTLFPNPSTDQVTVESTEEIGSLQVVNALGQVIFRSERLHAKSLQIEVRQWPKGNYLLHATTPSGNSTQRLIVK